MTDAQGPVDPGYAFNDLRPYLMVYAVIAGGVVPLLWQLSGILRVIALVAFGLMSIACLFILINHLKRSRWGRPLQ